MGVKNINNTTPPGRKDLYDTHVKPYLHVVEQFVRNGVTEESIAQKLNIAYNTFRRHKEKHAQLRAVLNTSREIADTSVENALYKSAHGYKETLKKWHKIKVSFYSETTGKLIRVEEQLVPKEEEIMIFPSNTAQVFWLKNRKPDTWQNNDRIVITTETEDDAIKELTNKLLKRDFRKLEVAEENDNEKQQEKQQQESKT